LLGEFDDKGSLVEFLVQAGLEGIEDGVGGADDFLGKVSVLGHGIRVFDHRFHRYERDMRQRRLGALNPVFICVICG
jgi:hypothetical protein